MLVLSRKLNESIVLGGPEGAQQHVTIKVIEIRGGSVRLGFDAPPEVRILRTEVRPKIAAESSPL